MRCGLMADVYGKENMYTRRARINLTKAASTKGSIFSEREK